MNTDDEERKECEESVFERLPRGQQYSGGHVLLAVLSQREVRPHTPKFRPLWYPETVTPIPFPGYFNEEKCIFGWISCVHCKEEEFWRRLMFWTAFSDVSSIVAIDENPENQCSL